MSVDIDRLIKWHSDMANADHRAASKKAKHLLTVEAIESLRARVAELEQQKMLADHHYSVMKVSAEVLAARCDAADQQNALLHLQVQKYKAGMKCLEEGLDELEGGCTRSHPHEDMNVVCQLRTELARATFEQAAEREKARGLQDTLANAVSADFHNEKMQELETIIDDASPIAGFISHLQARIAAEREKVRELEVANKSLSEHHQRQSAILAKIMRQLAASHLSEQRLREALETAKPYMDQSIEHLHAALAGYKPHVHKQADNDAFHVSAALINITGTAALDAYVAEKVEPWNKDALRYQHMRKSFEARNYDASDFPNPRLVWYLRQGDKNLPWADRLDAAIDAAIAAQEPKA